MNDLAHEGWAWLPRLCMGKKVSGRLCTGLLWFESVIFVKAGPKTWNAFHPRCYRRGQGDFYIERGHDG